MQTKLPEVACPYIPPDQCTDFTPAPCCERIEDDGDGGVDDGDAGVIVKTSMVLLLVTSVLAAVL